MVRKYLLGVMVGLGVFLILYIVISVSPLMISYLYVGAGVAKLGWYVSAESFLAATAIGAAAISASYIARSNGAVVGIAVLFLTIAANHLLSLGITMSWPSTAAAIAFLWVLYGAAAMAGGIFGEHLAGRRSAKIAQQVGGVSGNQAG